MSLRDLRESDAPPGTPRSYGVVAALPEELAPLAPLLRDRVTRAGLTLRLGEIGGARVVACVSGIGKVLAARAATSVVAEGATDGVFVVGVCGALRSSLPAGTLVHCTRAVQADLAVRDERTCDADPGLLAAWRRVAGGPAGWFLTADRPVLSPWRRLRLARAFAGAAVADMETAAVGAVCRASGVPWAALRAVTDGAGLGALVSFRRNYHAQAGRPVDTLPALLALLAEPPGGTSGTVA